MPKPDKYDRRVLNVQKLAGTVLPVEYHNKETGQVVQAYLGEIRTDIEDDTIIYYWKVTGDWPDEIPSGNVFSSKEWVLHIIVDSRCIRHNDP